MMLCPAGIHWETEESTLADFEYQYGNHLPQLFMVSDGFDGNELLHSFGSEDVLVVCSVAIQQRVVVHDSASRLLSIPLSYTLPVSLVNNNKVMAPKSLGALMADAASQNFSSNSVVFADNPVVTIQRGASEIIHSRCGVMNIIDLHSQKYLVGYYVVDGVVDKTPVLLPTYVPIHVTVAGMEGGAAEVARCLSDITPPGDSFSVEDHFNTDIMAVSFSDIEGDGYEYVNPASAHQTLSRITAKVKGLKLQAATTPLSLPREWMDSSEEPDQAINGSKPASPPPSLTTCIQRGTLERAKCGAPHARGEADDKPGSHSKSTEDISTGHDSRFLGGMRSISMIDLTQTKGVISLPKQESPAEKYRRKSDHVVKQHKAQASRSSSEESVASVGRLKKTKPALPPKPGKICKGKPDRQQQKLLHEIKSRDRKNSHGSQEAELVTKSIFSKSSRVPSLRNAKSMTDLSNMGSPMEPTTIIPVIDLKMKGNQQGNKKSQTFTPISAGQKKKKRPFLLRLFSGFSSNTDIDKPSLDSGKKTGKNAKGKSLLKSPGFGKYKRHMSSSDVEIAAQLADDKDTENSDSPGSVYSDIHVHVQMPDATTTVDLLSDIRKPHVKRVKQGKFRTSYERRGIAPALPPRNDEPAVIKEQLSPSLIPENDYEFLPDRPDCLSRCEELERKTATKSPSPSDGSSFVFEFDPSSADYAPDPTGHITEFDSGGETSDSDTDTVSSDCDKSSGEVKPTSQVQDKMRVGTSTRDIPDNRPPLPKPRPAGSVPLPSIASRIKALQSVGPPPQTDKPQAGGKHGDAPALGDLPADLPSLPSSRTSVASSASGTSELLRHLGLHHQESGYWSQSDNSYSDAISGPPVPPPPRPLVEHVAPSKYRTWSDIPDDISALTVEDVVDSLKLLKMTRYAEAFHEYDVDGELLSDLDEGVLIKDFGFSSFDAKKLVKFSKGWRPKLK